MAIEKRTVIDQIEIASTGVIGIRLGLLIVEDGEVIDRKWHRTIIEPGIDAEAQIAAVNSHMESMGRPHIDQGGLCAQLKGVTSLVHTKDRVAAFKAAREKTLAADSSEHQRDIIGAGDN